MKTSLKEVIDLVQEGKGDGRELLGQINATYDQFISFKQSQSTLNQKLCANNCVARWLFNSLSGSNLKLIEQYEDTFRNKVYEILIESASINACQENYVWTKASNQESNKLLPGQSEAQKIELVMAGIYEVQIGIMSDKPISNSCF